ncbi:nucleotidyltransferase substrate binding protein [Desulfobulbus rhabdoformis]|uniref:nucleotidyltransferase substrate binding protein n=1 Tax=Desulfobulbus rhabdoformis TaxID=34032 RepID=UPI001F0669CB|nr:nucleotidyltransferase substrate binding protein [Desulfobulbus rhabdoformis]
MKFKEIRWQQRNQNLQKAFKQLNKGLSITTPSDIEIQGIIQSFEFTFELCWKTLKDYLESQGVDSSFPREVIKQAFHYEILENGDIWLQMLTKRNFLAHTYDEAMAKDAYSLIKNDFFPYIQQLVAWFDAQSHER